MHSRSDLESSGLRKCLRTCYGLSEGEGCRDRNSCDLRVQCFHDHCVCHMAIRCNSNNSDSSTAARVKKRFAVIVFAIRV